MLKIIGFEYICNLYGTQYIEIAELLGISKQTINSWTSKRRKLPEKYLPILEEKFKIPQDYFQKEITDMDKIRIQRFKIDNEYREIEDNSFEVDLEKINKDIQILIKKLEELNGKHLIIEMESGFSSISNFRGVQVKFKQLEDDVTIVLLDKDKKNRMMMHTRNFLNTKLNDTTIEITTKHGLFTKITIKE